MKKLIVCLSLVLVVALGVVGLTACKKKNGPTEEYFYETAWVTSFAGRFDNDGNELPRLPSDEYDGFYYKFKTDHSLEVSDDGIIWEKEEGCAWQFSDGAILLGTTDFSTIVMEFKINFDKLSIQFESNDGYVVLDLTKVN